MRYFVTGANRGIGLGVARRLVERGDEVFAAARSPGKAEALKRLASEFPNRVDIVQLDVQDPDSVAALDAAVGDTPIDVLLNNAGRFSHAGHVGDFDYELFIEDYEVNTLGPLRVTEALIENVASSDARVICNTTSNLASLTQNETGDFYAYRASKAALNMMTRTLAAELRPRGITVVSLHPGWVKTDMGGKNADIEVDESVSGIVARLDEMGPELSGTYVTWDGRQLPW